MATNGIVSRTTVYDAGVVKLEKLEEGLQAEIDAMNNSSGEITQGQMLTMQYHMQSFTLFVQTTSTVQKEFSDMLKGIISKF